MNRDSNSPFITHSSFTSLNQIVQQVHQVQATTSQARSGVCIQRLIVLSPLYFHKPLHSRSSRYKQSQGITPRSDWDYLVCTPLYSLKDRVVIHHCWEIAQFAFNPLSLVPSLSATSTPPPPYRSRSVYGVGIKHHSFHFIIPFSKFHSRENYFRPFLSSFSSR